MIRQIGQLRYFNSYELAAIIRNHNCDADVAIIAAWWILHNKPPKNWAKHMQTALGKIVKYKVEKSKVSNRMFSDEIFKMIMKNYEDNKIRGANQALLPII